MKKIEPGVLKLNIADRPQDFYSKIAGSRAAVIFLALVGIFAGVFVFILPCLHITYDKTEARTVNYVNFEAEQSRSFEGKMRFSDGTDGNVYVRDGAEEFAGVINALEAGEPLEIRVNPRNGYILEIKTGDGELLGFDKAESEVYDRVGEKRFIGIMFITLSVFLLAVGLIYNSSLNKERERQKKKNEKMINGTDTPAIRSPKTEGKTKILLSSKVKDYEIVYRRTKTVNELVVNGYVYDSMKALVEVTHELSAVVDGHEIAVGLDYESYSYIKFDGAVVAKKRRLI